jgi:RNA polymerase sigma-70 factor, ECF subfamily
VVRVDGDDDQRWRTVFEAEQARMFRTLLAHVGDAEVAADAVAEAFAQGLRRGDAVRDPAAWVWRTAFRVAAGLAAERRRSPAPLGVGRGADPVDPAAVPDEVVALLDALGRLPEPDRRVVVLGLVGGLGAAEVGAIVGARPGAVRVRLHRARRRLQAALADQPSPDPEEVP